MGLHAAQQILRLEAGQPTETFHYHDKGQAATIGRRSAVIELAHGPDFTGTLAWLGWLGLHLFYLLGGRNRVSALINLTWRYMTWGHGGTVIVGDEPTDSDEPAAFRPGAAAGRPLAGHRPRHRAGHAAEPPRPGPGAGRRPRPGPPVFLILNRTHVRPTNNDAA